MLRRRLQEGAAPLPLRARTRAPFRLLRHGDAPRRTRAQMTLSLINEEFKKNNPKGGRAAPQLVLFYSPRAASPRAVRLARQCATSTWTARYFPRASPPADWPSCRTNERARHAPSGVRVCARARGERLSVSALFARQRHARFAWVWRRARTFHSHTIHGSANYVTPHSGWAGGTCVAHFRDRGEARDSTSRKRKQKRELGWLKDPI